MKTLDARTALRVLVTLVMLLTPLQPVAAAVSCAYQQRSAVAGCDGSMADMEHASATVTGAGSHVRADLVHVTDCAFATVCAASAPAIVLSDLSLAPALAMQAAVVARPTRFAPGERAPPPTQPPRA